LPKHVTLLPHLSTDDLEHRYRGAPAPHERSWWQILWLLSRGQSARQVAQSTGYSPYWIGQLAKRYNTEGPAGMRNGARTESYRRPPLLDAAL
jgi:Winged helix-turn helix